MSSLYSVENLAKFVSKETNERLSTQDIVELIRIDDDTFTRDNPTSIGKRLKVNSLSFFGEKDDGTVIDYSKTFDDGINLWVGDNLVGKTSILNIVKLALTGNKKSLARDVLKWIEDVWLCFSVGSNRFTVHVQTDSYKFELFSSSQEEIVSLSEEQRKDYLIGSGGVNDHEVGMKDLFFRELDYYSLKWTQRSSQKDDPRLLTPNASWKTYFKSIFLEAEDYSSLMYGNQSALIFQMLLGLPYTYPINQLKVKKEELQNELGLLKIGHSQTNGNVNEFLEELKQVDNDIETLETLRKNANLSNRGIKEDRLLEAQKKRSEVISNLTQLQASIQHHETKAANLRKGAHKHREDINEYAVEINKKKRSLTQLKEATELGSFFNDLVVKRCPNCSSEVEVKKIKHEKDTGQCRLCDHEIDNKNHDFNNYEERIEQLNSGILDLNKDQYNIRIELEGVESDIKKLEGLINILTKESDRIDLKSVDVDIESMRNELSKVPSEFDLDAYIEKSKKLIGRKAVLEEKLKNAGYSGSGPESQLKYKELQIEALSIAQEKLSEWRSEGSKSIIEKLEKLYLEQLRAFSVSHFDRVEVSSDFRVTYHKHGDRFKYEEISSGEKLRAKLGLYIALIEMDIEFQLGRHPRFLIIDAPAKEEGDSQYVDGLRETLRFIEDKFGSDLQVFVCTAERELTNAIDLDKVEVRGEKEYFF